MNRQHKRSFPQYTIGTPSAFLAERIREASNLEMEWLWAAEQVTDSHERRYCLERAFDINPNNQETLQTLVVLTRKPNTAFAPKPFSIRRLLPLGLKR